MLKVIFCSLLAAFLAVPAYCQGISANHQIKIINGTVVNVDAVGNIITIQTQDPKANGILCPGEGKCYPRNT